MSVDPGGVATETVLEAQGSVPVIGSVLKFVIGKLARTPLDGAATALFAATSPTVRAKPEKFKGAFIADFGVIGKPSKDALSPELATKLWTSTEEISAKILAEEPVASS